MLSLTIHQEMQIKTTVRYHFTPVRMAVMTKLNKQTNKQVLVKTWRKGNPRAPLVGMQPSAAAVESGVTLPPKSKNGTAL